MPTPTRPMIAAKRSSIHWPESLTSSTKTPPPKAGKCRGFVLQHPLSAVRCSHSQRSWADRETGLYAIWVALTVLVAMVKLGTLPCCETAASLPEILRSSASALIMLIVLRQVRSNAIAIDISLRFSFSYQVAPYTWANQRLPFGSAE